MKYGENTALVEEVIDFARGSGLFQNSDADADANWHVIHDLDDAMRFAREAVIGPDEYLWTDLRELEMADVWGRSYELEGFAEAEDALTETLELLTMAVRRRLDAEHGELLDDIVGDLYCCAFNRAVIGASGFFERLFKAYRAGGWPCGWLGEYPAGQLVVYVHKQ
jgi:hypothetical protein